MLTLWSILKAGVLVSNAAWSCSLTPRTPSAGASSVMAFVTWFQ